MERRERQLAAGIDVRRAQADEMAAIEGLVRDVVQTTCADVDGHDPRGLASSWTGAWVAYDAERVVGAILTGTAGPEWIHELWIAESHQTRGIGSSLLARAERESAECGCATARLHVLATNFDALAFYGRRGWNYIRTLAREPPGHDLIELVKALR